MVDIYGLTISTYYKSVILNRGIVNTRAPGTGKWLVTKAPRHAHAEQPGHEQAER